MSNRQQATGNLALEQKKVIVIGATQKPEGQKLRVAAYCRVSTRHEEQYHSLEAQISYLYELYPAQSKLENRCCIF